MLVSLAATGGLALALVPAQAALADGAFGGSVGSASTAGGTAAPSSSASPAGGKASTPSPPQAHTAASIPTAAPASKPADGELTGAIPENAAPSKAGVPLPIILLAILGGILLLVGLFVLLARFFGWGFERWQPTLQTWREAGYQSQNMISDFVDWVRGGR